MPIAYPGTGSGVTLQIDPVLHNVWSRRREDSDFYKRVEIRDGMPEEIDKRNL